MKIFENIGTLLTLKGAASNGGVRPTIKDLGIIRKGCMIEDRGRIVWVGPQSQLSKQIQSKNIPKNTRRIDLGGRTVLPGFVECHTHSVFAGSRSEEFELRITGVSYEDIAKRGGGILSTVKSTRKATLNQLIDLLDLRVQKVCSAGSNDIRGEEWVWFVPIFRNKNVKSSSSHSTT
ncbi:MAG: hypothetical protein R2827_07230 [Bdellovibrionales bacterium]